MKKIYFILVMVLITILCVTACRKNNVVPNNQTTIETTKGHFPQDEAYAIEVFNDNMDVFSEFQEYYSTIEYKKVIKETNNSKLLEIDGVEYEIALIGDEYFITYYDARKQNGFENLPSSVLKIRELTRNYKGISVRIDKESLDVIDIQINISNDVEGYSLWIVWGKTPADIENCNIPLTENWAIYSMDYAGI